MIATTTSNAGNIIRRTVTQIISVLAATALVLAMCPATAHAESLEELSKKVEETSKAYNDAQDEQERLAKAIAKAKKKIKKIEKRLPALTADADIAVIGLYKQSNSVVDIVNALLGMRTLKEAVRLYEDYSKITDYNLGLLSEASNAKRELEEQKAQLESDKKAQDKAVKDAKKALEEAQSARTAAQAEARAQASGSALASAIDWKMGKDEFVKEWTKRIDRYLSGTPLSGTGKFFADAAYKNGCDPRLSPAISRIESGCGAACFRAHNAWGWMGHSFGSWEDAIYAHVQYLAGPLYGGYLTLRGARTYCPPTYQDWYSKVSGEMGKM